MVVGTAILVGAISRSITPWAIRGARGTSGADSAPTDRKPPTQLLLRPDNHLT
jgi:hypothetical protein